MKKWTLAKDGNLPEENEDAAQCGSDFVAVADGATEATYSRIWAQGLVTAMVEAESAAFWADPIATFWQRTALASERWQAQLPKGEQPWYVQHKNQQGSGAALGLLLLDRAQQRWRGIAVGDVIIVQLRQNQRMCTWPLECSTQFNTTPALVGTKATPDREDIPLLDASFQQGDQFLVMTDALAAWSLLCEEQGAPRWADLLAIATPEAWENLVQSAREQGMRNDDVTLMQVETADATETISLGGSVQSGCSEPTSDAERSLEISNA